MDNYNKENRQEYNRAYYKAKRERLPKKDKEKTQAGQDEVNVKFMLTTINAMLANKERTTPYKVSCKLGWFQGKFKRVLQDAKERELLVEQDGAFKLTSPTLDKGYG